MLAAFLAGARAAQPKFTDTLRPEDLAATGLAEATPAQLARLDALVDEYKRGLRLPVRRPAADPVAEAAPARPPVEHSSVPPKSGGLLAKAKGILKPAPTAKVEDIVADSSIVGTFGGWRPQQIFTLANGQRWRVSSNESYYTPAVENPRVQVVPAAIAGYWLRFPDLGTQVRVNFVGE